MGRPRKIRKKKSFMFTSKHHSFTGWSGFVVGIVTVVTTILMALESYKKAGSVPKGFGGVGFFTIILNIIGVIFGMMGMNERDVFKTIPIATLIVNGMMILFWIFIIVISNV